MNDDIKDRNQPYQQQSPELKELIGAIALSGLDDIDQLIDPSNHSLKTTSNDTTNQ